jgi:Tat protein secretion system quality control protein TatD with DNase activity
MDGGGDAREQEGEEEGTREYCTRTSEQSEQENEGRRRRLFSTVGVHPTRCGEFEASGDAEGYLSALKDIAVCGSYRSSSLDITGSGGGGDGAGGVGGGGGGRGGSEGLSLDSGCQPSVNQRIVDLSLGSGRQLSATQPISRGVDGGDGSRSRSRGRVVAIGECGLDYDRLEFCPRATQMEW